MALGNLPPFRARDAASIWSIWRIPCPGRGGSNDLPVSWSLEASREISRSDILKIEDHRKLLPRAAQQRAACFEKAETALHCTARHGHHHNAVTRRGQRQLLDRGTAQVDDRIPSPKLEDKICSVRPLSPSPAVRGQGRRAGTSSSHAAVSNGNLQLCRCSDLPETSKCLGGDMEK